MLAGDVNGSHVIDEVSEHTRERTPPQKAKQASPVQEYFNINKQTVLRDFESNANKRKSLLGFVPSGKKPSEAKNATAARDKEQNQKGK